LSPASAPTGAPPPSSITSRAVAQPAVPRVRHAARPASNEEETALLLDAMRALRRQSDPARARVLLGRYLQQNPNGALAEEALAMSIEAAVAAHDGDAPALARHYLRSYPSGPFRSVAVQALGTAPAP
jgi:outer membrane PBP1 activator LpoA protein